jgi:hypothetical protein
MPHFTFLTSRDGYAFQVLIGLRTTDLLALQAAGQPLPPPVQARALLDTATDKTAVAARLLQQLGVPPGRPVSTHTAGGMVTVQLYEVSLSILNPTGASSPMLTRGEWVVAEFLHAPPNVDVLIGLDLAGECLTIIDGPGGRFTLGF